MGISVEEAVKELRNRDEVFVAYSQATKLPYVTCDEETFNDQARIFATEEEIKEYGKKLLEDKVLLMGMKYEKKDFPRLYGTLYAIGGDSGRNGEPIWKTPGYVESYMGRNPIFCELLSTGVSGNTN